MRKRVLIVGGVAGGASCAARLRRLDETAEIVMFDRGPHVSFANCGLPYFVGDVITEERKLLVATSELFLQRFDIHVRTRHEVTAIDRARSTIAVTDLAAGVEREEPYDALVLSPGRRRSARRMPGVDLPGIFAVRTIPDSVRHPLVDRAAAAAEARSSWAAGSSGSRWPRTWRAAGSRSRCWRSCRR